MVYKASLILGRLLLKLATVVVCLLCTMLCVKLELLCRAYRLQLLTHYLTDIQATDSMFLASC